MIRRSTLSFAAIPFAAAIAAMVFAIGCRSDEPSDTPAVTELTDPRDAISEELMVALAQAKNFHHKADVYLKDARSDDAIAAVKQILEVPFPPNAPEGVDVMLDARARLAKLLVTKGALDEAMAVTDAGLSSTDRDSFFLANLHTVRGHVWEARAQRADETGATEDGRAARINAVKDFDRAIQINKVVLKRLAQERD